MPDFLTLSQKNPNPKARKEFSDVCSFRARKVQTVTIIRHPVLCHRILRRCGQRSARHRRRNSASVFTASAQCGTGCLCVGTLLYSSAVDFVRRTVLSDGQYRCIRSVFIGHPALSARCHSGRYPRCCPARPTEAVPDPIRVCGTAFVLRLAHGIFIRRNAQWSYCSFSLEFS